MRRLLFFLIFIASLSAGVFFQSLHRNEEIFRAICDLTERSFYKPGPQLEDWARRCRRLAVRVPSHWSKAQLIESIQDHMSTLNVSHFLIYSPVEDKKMWTGVAVDTGLRTRFIEDHLIVYKVLRDSPGEMAGVKAGDEILSIEGAEEVTPWGAQNRSGRFTFLTNDQTWDADIKAAELKTDGGPELKRLNERTGLLEIPSFRSEFFEAEAWRGLVAGFKSYHHLIIDVRENAGGNFVAMLRALSPFRCGGQNIGSLLRARHEGDEIPEFNDDTSDAYQIDQIESSSRIGLSTFADYGCFDGAVTVLISAETSSVAEIFAQSFLKRPRSRVWGQPSAGDVVLAIWYDLPALGAGYSISIPEAVYVTPENLELENRGVKPQREIFYNLGQARRGLDTFITEAEKGTPFLFLKQRTK